MSEKPEPRDIGILVLAAGSGRRFGGDKRLAALGDGRTLLESTLSRIPSSFSRKLLVLRAGDEALAGRFAGGGWQICFAPEAEKGMGHSLAAGISRARDWEGVLIGLGDMPFIRPATYGLLQDALCRHAITLPVLALEGRRGNPVGFRREFFGELALLQGDRGARDLLEKHVERVHEVPTGDPGIVRDVDTWEGLANEWGGPAR